MAAATRWSVNVLSVLKWQNKSSSDKISAQKPGQAMETHFPPVAGRNKEELSQNNVLIFQNGYISY